MNSRIAVIYNPMARGGKARRLRRRLEQLGAQCTFMPTDAPGAATGLALRAINEGFETVVACGGDGTLNEVVNGMATSTEGLKRARLGLIPLGTVNVFAKELCLPMNLERAWKTILRGNERSIDLGVANFEKDGRPQRRFFIQLGGAGLDARAIELVNWNLKKAVLQFAYVVAGIRALAETKPLVVCETPERVRKGPLVLLGNGRFYGGMLPVFPNANLSDGRLHVCVFERLNLFVIMRYAMGFLSGQVNPPGSVSLMSAREIKLSSDQRAPFELEGDLVGHLPATFRVHDQTIRVIVP